MTIEEKDITSLLSQVGAIKQKYDQIAEITGEKFNVFSILGLQDREVRLHSAFIGELLNPKGSHSQKDLFLKLFINQLNKIDFNLKQNNDMDSSNQLELKFDFKFESITLYKEKRSEFGQIDLLITNNNKQCIIIENKIWAEDQCEQLIRYNDFIKRYYDNRNSILLYLAPYNGKPDNKSIIGVNRENEEITLRENVDYFCLDYKDDILPWLEECRKEASSLPLIRETISQYINIIKNYYGQSINHMETENIISLLSSTENNINTSFTISRSLDNLRNTLYEKLLKELIAVAEKEHNLIIGEYDDKIGTSKYYKYTGISFKKSNWQEFQIRFEFEYNCFNDLYFGIRKKNEQISETSENFLFIEKSINKDSSNWWPYYEYFESNNRWWWENVQVWIDIQNGKMLNNFKVKLKIILDIIDEKKLEQYM